MTKENVLAIDIGTQSVRALVFDSSGALKSIGKAIYHTPYHSPKPGYAEQHPSFYFEKLTEACSKLWGKEEVSPDSIAGLCVTSQRSTVVNLDKNGTPLRPAIVWLDQRRSSHHPHIHFPFNLAFKLPVLHGIMSYVQSEAEINWIYQHEKEIWEKTAYYLMLSGYINHKLTGKYVDSTACQVGYIPFDYKNFSWLKESHWKWGAMKVKPGTLPELVPPGEQLGTLTAEAASMLGIPNGIPVIAGASDKACEVLGCGCLNESQACIGFGTTATINVNSHRYIEPMMLIPPYPSGEKGAYNIEVQTYRGFWMVTWFKENFAALEDKAAEEMEIDTETLLDRLAEKVPPGSLGLTLQPYWSPGLKYPGSEAKGSIIGFGSVHKKQHMYRALLEGLVYSMRQGRERIERKTKTGIKELYVCGGGSRSDLVMQITADIFNLNAVRPAVSETSGLGAAILAAAGTGMYSSLNQAVTSMVHTGSVFEPELAHAERYNELYKKVYLKQYKKLRPLYRAIRKITGYPE